MENKKQKISLQIKIQGVSQTYEIDKTEFVLGRGDTSEVVINDQGVSREHLLVKLETPTVISIEDLKSSNGTFLNGKKLFAKEVIKGIKGTDILRLGNGDVKIQLTIVTVAVPKGEEADVNVPTEVITQDSIIFRESDGVGNLQEDAVPAVVEMEKEFEAESRIAAAEAAVVRNPEKSAISELEKSEVKKPKISSSKKNYSEPLILKADPDVDSSDYSNPSGAPEKLSIEDIANDHPPINIDLSAFPKTPEDFRLSFKKVGVLMPVQKTASQQSQELLKEAEHLKQSILKSAQVYKIRTISEAKIQAKMATDEAYVEYQKMIDVLLEDTRRTLSHLQTETEMLLDDKRLQASEEMQNLWKEHEENIRQDKEKQLEIIENENKVKLDMSLEKLKSDMFSERHRIITEAENEILHKKRTYQTDFENEKSEHLKRIKLFSEQLAQIQQNIKEAEDAYKKCKTQKEYSELELSKVLSQLKLEKENLDHTIQSFQETREKHKEIEREVEGFTERKQKFELELSEARRNIEELKAAHITLSEKKDKLSDEATLLVTQLEDSKKKTKSELEIYYKNLKDLEAKKFEEYQANELKEFQKIRDAHAQTIKKFSMDLSQEIATKVEMQSKKSGNASFDFEKNLELINSVIQVKSSMDTGSESKHALQIENWKNRKKKENAFLMSSGFAAGLIAIVLGNMVYKKLNTDPVQDELARIAIERKQRNEENMYIPNKVEKYFDNYVDATLYTDKFTEVYLNDQVQQEWVNFATKYFLRQWKVEEEKVIKVISNSRAFVQSVDESKGTLKKDRIKTDLAKLKASEEENIQSQASILGTNVKYEAYKKLEKEFFNERLQKQRFPAGK